MSLSSHRLLWAAIGVLAACLVLEWLWPSASGAPAQIAAARLSRHAAAGQALPARDTSAWGDAVLARPIFSVSRRPPRVLASSHAEAAAGQARLSGIMISRYGRRALFAPEGGGKQLVLAEGAAINESTIQRIQPDRVILASGTVLLPSYDHNRVGPPPTTPPFQPVGTNGVFPNFPGQGFPNPGFPAPGLINPGFPNPNNPTGAMPGQPQPGLAPAGDDAGAPAQPPPPRGTMIPQRRE